MACCERCCTYDAMEREHGRAQADLYDYFAQEHYFAICELHKLERLYTDVAWYNFELECATWNHPWPQSVGSSMLMLCGVRHNLRSTTYPVYYSGSLDDAPKLPTEILLSEIALAKRWVQKCEESCCDVYEYAPGGNAHQALVHKYQKGEVQSLSVLVPPIPE